MKLIKAGLLAISLLLLCAAPLLAGTVKDYTADQAVVNKADNQVVMNSAILVSGDKVWAEIPASRACRLWAASSGLISRRCTWSPRPRSCMWKCP